jgi:hypothetical protein
MDEYVQIDQTGSGRGPRPDRRVSGRYQAAVRAV